MVGGGREREGHKLFMTITTCSDRQSSVCVCLSSSGGHSPAPHSTACFTYGTYSKQGVVVSPGPYRTRTVHTG